MAWGLHDAVHVFADELEQKPAVSYRPASYDHQVRI